jgi:hypothetical protein
MRVLFFPASFLALFAVLLTASCSKKEEQKYVVSDVKTIKSNEIGKGVQLLGRLGVPLGTVRKVKGEIVPPRNNKSEFNQIIFRVDAVDGVALPQSEYFQLKPAYGSQDVMKQQSTMRFYCYESGLFGGIPNEAFEHMPRVGTTAFGFKTFLVGPLDK